MNTRERLAEALIWKPGTADNLAKLCAPDRQDIAAALLPVVEAIAAERAAEELRKAIRAVQAVYDLQCPAMTPDMYVGAGAHSAHLWWEKVLGGELDELRARVAALTEADR